MNAADRELEALLRSEADLARPPDGAKERGLARLMAAVADGEGGPGEGDPGGAPPAVPALKVAPALKGASLIIKVVPLVTLLIVGALVTWGLADSPAIVADAIDAEVEPKPATLYSAPITIPFAPEQGPAPLVALDTPPPAIPEAKTRPRMTAKPPASDEDNFADELGLLAAGQAAIQRGELAQGLALLRSHKRRFPRGQFAQERDALIAIARCERGQAGAQAAGEKFVQTHPGSIHADRVRAACKY